MIKMIMEMETTCNNDNQERGEEEDAEKEEHSSSKIWKWENIKENVAKAYNRYKEKIIGLSFDFREINYLVFISS